MKERKSFSNEVMEYTRNKFDINVDIPVQIPDEDFIATFRSMIASIGEYSISEVLNRSFPHGEKDIVFKNESDVTLEVYNSIAGNIPVFYANNVDDFKELVGKLIYKGRDVNQPDSVGASFAYGANVKFIILSNKPYSGIPAADIDLTDEQWRKFSIIIRREHECTHYFTKRFLSSSRNNIHDELVADFAGIVAATGTYHPTWFLKGMGIDKFPEKQAKGRFEVYTSELTGADIDAVKEITIKAANNVKEWFDMPDVQMMSMRDKILFLCGKGLLGLSEMYD